MRETSTVTGGQATAAILGVVLLAHGVPLLGLLMIPVVAVAAAGRALIRTAAAVVAPR